MSHSVPPAVTQTVLVPDTSFWIQATDPLGTFPYSGVVGTSDFVIAVPFAVLEELDGRIKSGTKAQRFKGRRLRAQLLAVIENGTDHAGHTSGQTSNGLTVWLMAAGPDDDTGKVPDARIVQAAHNLSDDGLSALILTRDGHMILRAKSAGVPAKLIPDQLCDEDEDEPLEKSVHDLNRRLAKVEAPDLLRIQLLYDSIYPRAKELQLTHVTGVDESFIDRLHKDVLASLRIEEQSDEYSSRLRGYAEAVLIHLVKRAKYEQAYDASALVRFRVVNQSSQLVNFAALIIKASDNVSFERPADLEAAPQPPEPPEASFLGMSALRRAALAARIPFIPGLASVRGVRSRDEPTTYVYSDEVRVKFDEPLRPDYPTWAADIWLFVPWGSTASTVDLKWVLHPGQGRPVSGTLNLPLVWKTRPWEVPRLPAADDSEWKPGPSAGRRDLYEASTRQA